MSSPHLPLHQWSSRHATIATLVVAGICAVTIGFVAVTGLDGTTPTFAVYRESVTVTASDGVRIVGVLRRPATDTATRYPVVVLLHDTGDDRTAWTDVESFFLSEGYATLTIDRRGHGGSTTRVVAGETHTYVPSGSLEDEMLDLTAVFAWIGGRTDIRTEDVRLIGAGSAATLAYRASGTYSQLVSTVSLDPTLGPGAVESSSTTPFVRPKTVFVVSGRDDAVARSLFDRIDDPRQLRTYRTDVRGIALLRSAAIRSDVITWLHGLTVETTDGATP